jgi:D-3-phosphoglycerate dehydrogenase
VTAEVRIVITDCDHDDVQIERAVAAEHGATLTLAQCHSEDEVIEAAAGADGIVVQYAPITERVLDALPDLKVVGRYGVGVDTVDVAAATNHSVAVCNVPDYGTEDVSDHALALALSLGRGLPQLDRNLRAGSIDLGPVRPLHRFNTQTFGVVGLGLIGAATGRKARGVGFTVIGSDPARTVGEITEEGIEVVSFDDLVTRSDVISLHVPLIEATHHLIDEEVLQRVKPHSILVNTCRGGVADTDAVLRALQDGRLAGAGLDVLEDEPLDPDAPIAAQPNAILTPHAAWYSDESYGELKRRVVENVLAVCAGERARDVLNPEVLP